MSSGKILYVDMDGVLVDYESGVLAQNKAKNDISASK
jgi:hypothetical protein